MKLDDVLYLLCSIFMATIFYVVAVIQSRVHKTPEKNNVQFIFTQ